MVVVIVVNVVVVALGLKHPKQHWCVASEQGVPQLSHVSQLQAALRFGSGFPLIPAGPEFRVSTQGPQDPN